MDQRYSILTLGTADMARARGFYEGLLGWKPFMTEGITFYDAGGFILGLFGHKELAEDANLSMGPIGEGYRGFAVAYNARHEEEVDALLALIETQGKSHGAKVVKPAHKAFWGGYSGYFTDPDGNAWEVAYNPFWPIDDTGHLQLPKAQTT